MLEIEHCTRIGRWGDCNVIQLDQTVRRAIVRLEVGRGGWYLSVLEEFGEEIIC